MEVTQDSGCRKTVADLFSSSFPDAPVAIAQSPGRVEVLGNHTDYNQGVTLSAAIDRSMWIAAGPGDPGRGYELVSTQFPGVTRIRDLVRQHESRWTNYVVGVAALLRDAGYPVRPFRAAVHGTIPMGAGLSSSAALEVATGLALSRLFGFSIDRERLAAICQRAEHEFCGSKCGLLDQYSVLFGEAGKLLHIDFRTLEHRTESLPRDGISLAITPSGVTHSLGESAYNDRRAECFRAAAFFARDDATVTALRDVSMDRLVAATRSLDPVDYRRALHVVGENDRVVRGMQLLAGGDLAGFGRLLFDSHESSRVNFENSCPELDALVDIARTIPGVHGVRLSGGGFGGAALALLDTASRDAFAATTVAEFRRRTGRETAVHFAAIAGGARVEE